MSLVNVTALMKWKIKSSKACWQLRPVKQKPSRRAIYQRQCRLSVTGDTDRGRKKFLSEIIRKWKKKGLGSDGKHKVLMMSCLSDKLYKDSEVKEAQLVFDEMGKWVLHPIVVSFNTLINGYYKSRNLEEGFRLKRVMEESRTYANVFTYSVLITALCKECRLDNANELFVEMCHRGLVPNDATFTALIGGQCKCGRVDLAMETFQEMLRKNIEPDLVT
ncbi:putative pentatricopeptide repeat-containing protein At1g09680 [Ziziphus jujuba]|uniref:Pentatricopeptide repeat-containing protein At1g09680 n=1 Tax=Ziziphus jujuba TaxID=326968 RepID=A0ABM3ZRS2_ZIZJJ|nr:putative pentatricopeptide repeat-containing protein At1g09680 [Ziziphus jujuba]